jgi:hypothetical protein
MYNRTSLNILIIGMITMLPLTGCDYWLKTRDVETRVKAVFNGMLKAPSSSKFEVAALLWDRGKYEKLDNTEYLVVFNQFNAWRGEMGLARKISKYKITDMEVVEDADPPAVIVTILIEGAYYEMYVPEGEQIYWYE